MTTATLAFDFILRSASKPSAEWVAEFDRTNPAHAANLASHLTAGAAEYARASSMARRIAAATITPAITDGKVTGYDITIPAVDGGGTIHGHYKAPKTMKASDPRDLVVRTGGGIVKAALGAMVKA